MPVTTNKQYDEFQVRFPDCHRVAFDVNPGACALAPANARFYLIGIENGAMVKSPFIVKFGIERFSITPAGTSGKRRHTAGPSPDRCRLVA
jgi:hypothetical protein